MRRLLVDYARTKKRLKRGGLIGAVCNAGFPVIGGPAILAEIHRMTFKQMVGRYDLVCGLFRHDLLQHVPVCARRPISSARVLY